MKLPGTFTTFSKIRRAWWGVGFYRGSDDYQKLTLGHVILEILLSFQGGGLRRQLDIRGKSCMNV
jgi:hypothetical protein